MAETLTLEEALAELEKVAPEAPFLALGQTIFWDEPMKGGILLASRRLGYKRKLVAGVHDTDYFAKLPSGPQQPGKYRAVPHNDTTTKGLWSAAAEFSTLFGSETVITREILQKAGLRIGKITRVRPNILDEATEAWGWRGIVSLEDQTPITAEIPLPGLFKELYSTLDWALSGALECLEGEDRKMAEELADRLKAILCTGADNPDIKYLGQLYVHLLQEVYDFCANLHVDLTTTATTELLRFNSETAELPRFRLLDVFLRHGEEAGNAYDEAIKGSEIYPLARFGSGAIPFELVIPGHGRGTIRIAPRAVVIMTPKPQFIPIKKPIGSVQDLAAAIESKLGSECTLVGKAVTLIGMLAAEYVFVFHEGASSYVKYSRKLHDMLAPLAPALRLNPIFRVKYSPWDELDTCCAWVRLPEPFRAAFGAEDICAPSLAARWRGVDEEQEALLARLGELRRPIDLIHFLEGEVGGFWKALADEYGRIHDRLEGLKEKVQALRKKRIECYDQMRELRKHRIEAERAKGDHFRGRIFEQAATEEDLEERERLSAQLEAVIERLRETKLEIRRLMREQQGLVRDPEILKLHERRLDIEVEAGLKRLSLIRSAVISGKGLIRANNRPSAWWFPLLCPDGLWFRSTVENAQCYLEPLQA